MASASPRTDGITFVTGMDYGQVTLGLRPGAGHPARPALRPGLILQGDSDELLYGGGTGGSRSLICPARRRFEVAADRGREGMKLASGAFEAAEADIVFEAGSFRVAGTDRRVTLAQLGIDAKGALDVELVTDTPPSTCPNGCQVDVAEVEVDPETGRITLVGYSAVDDFGTLVNPLLVEGQVHGGGPGDRPGADRARRLRRLGPARLQSFHTTTPGPRRRSAGLVVTTVPGDHQLPGCQGLRRGRHHRGLAAVVHAVLDAGALWHHASRCR
ncbi:MAG: molybdopterin cofactor-binding domain-containing protein [Geminicoccaceae bacterium]